MCARATVVKKGAMCASAKVVERRVICTRETRVEGVICACVIVVEKGER